jgi:multidrug efflux pump subunit AcrA (membrane-fusion protein)
VSPAYRADQRALTVEAVVPNTDDALKPGMFVSAEITLPATDPSLVVPTDAIRTVAGISHVFVLRGDKVEQRMITPGVTLGPVTEVLKGLSAAESVATSGIDALSDGATIRVQQQPSAATGTPAPGRLTTK